MVTKVRRLQKKPDYLMTIPEVAQTVRCSDETVRRWIRGNKLAAVTLPSGEYRIRYAELAKLIRAEGADPA